MIAYIEFLGMPTVIAISIVALLVIANVIGTILDLKGKVVPEFMNLRKYFARKKNERQTMEKIPEAMKEVKTLLDDVNQHYSADNIKMRDSWINTVNTKLDDNESVVNEINKKIDQNSRDISDLRDDITELRLENKRETIIDFAEKVCDERYLVTREQFTRIFKIYNDYENIIEERGLTNGEVDVAHKIINEAYQARVMNHTFLEDIKWHGSDQ